MRQQARTFDPAVEGYVSYACESSGKRLRPALALLAGGATGEINSSHLDLAVVLELIHAATLVHDDIMDGADKRRGQPTANAKWGNAISVLLGDCLFAHALKLSTNFPNGEISRRMASAASDVCSGEIIQTQRRFDLKLSVADYFRIIEMKTAALFAAASELGAFINEASPEIISAMKTFGLRFGTAYQIYDDCLDLAGNEENAGKTLGTDLRKGKLTLPHAAPAAGGLAGGAPPAERDDPARRGGGCARPGGGGARRAARCVRDRDHGEDAARGAAAVRRCCRGTSTATRWGRCARSLLEVVAQFARLGRPRA